MTETAVAVAEHPKTHVDAAPVLHETDRTVAEVKDQPDAGEITDESMAADLEQILADSTQPDFPVTTPPLIEGEKNSDEDPVLTKAKAARVALSKAEHPGQELSAEDQRTLEDDVTEKFKNGTLPDSYGEPDIINPPTTTAKTATKAKPSAQAVTPDKHATVATPDTSVKVAAAHEEDDSVEEDDEPEPAPEKNAQQDEAEKKRRVSARTAEVQIISRRIMDEKTKDIVSKKVTPEDPVWKQQGGLYKDILALQTAPDGDITHLNALNTYGEALWIKPDDNGNYIAASYADARAIQLTRVIRKDGNTLTCVNDSKDSTYTISIMDLADAQSLVVLKSKGADSVFNKDEGAVVQAIGSGNSAAVDRLYEMPVDFIKLAEKHGSLGADVVVAYLDLTYVEAVAAPGEALTLEQVQRNLAIRSQKEAVLKQLNLDVRLTADETTMVGVSNATTEYGIAKLEDAWQSEADPVEKAKLKYAIDMMNDKKQEMPKFMKTVLSGPLSKELIADLRDSLSKGDLAGVYKIMGEKMADKKEALDKLRNSFGEKALLLAGGGLIALLVAIVYGATTAGMKQR